MLKIQNMQWSEIATIGRVHVLLFKRHMLERVATQLQHDLWFRLF